MLIFVSVVLVTYDINIMVVKFRAAIYNISPSLGGIL